MRRILMIYFFVLYSLNDTAQPRIYSPTNAHSHNDYENPRPFHAAYEHAFGSIEADIFLLDGKLFVAHDEHELKLRRTLEDLYLRPLDSVLQAHNEHAYADTKQSLQILIDVKTEAKATLAKLIEILRNHPTLINTPSLRWVISGNRPPQNEFASYPPFILFDGVMSQSYEAPALQKIAMMSDNFKSYSSWNGLGALPETDKSTLEEIIGKWHSRHIPVRFWNAPDQPEAWTWFIRLKSDFINTDHIPELATFLNASGGKGNERW